MLKNMKNIKIILLIFFLTFNFQNLSAEILKKKEIIYFQFSL